MALQGSLDDFALPDVLALLAGTGKSGELHVDGDRGEGRVWFEDGGIVASAAGSGADHVDAVFELLRFSAGSFTFSAGATVPDSPAPVPMAPVLAEATERLAEWPSIEAVVPSLALPVRLKAEAPASPVVIEADQWAVLVAVAEGGTAGAVASTLAMGEFGACRAVKDLVDAGLVSVVLPAPPPEPEPVMAEPAPVAEPVAAEPVPEPVAEPHVDWADGNVAPLEDAEPLLDDTGEPINRSLLLKFLSSVRS